MLQGRARLDLSLFFFFSLFSVAASYAAAGSFAFFLFFFVVLRGISSPCGGRIFFFLLSPLCRGSTSHARTPDFLFAAERIFPPFFFFLFFLLQRRCFKGEDVEESFLSFSLPPYASSCIGRERRPAEPFYSRRDRRYSQKVGSKAPPPFSSHPVPPAHGHFFFFFPPPPGRKTIFFSPPFRQGVVKAFSFSPPLWIGA